jgi:hypothetical protein
MQRRSRSPRRAARGAGPRRGVPAEIPSDGMRLRTHLLIVLVVGALTFGSTAFAAAAASGDRSPGSTFRLVCPLH